MKRVFDLQVYNSGLGAIKQPIWIAVLFGLFLLFAIIRIGLLEYSEIWLDEAMTWHYASQPWGSLSAYIGTNDVHPPLYFLMVKAFTVFGDAPWALRLCGLVAELLALPLIYWIAWTLAPEREKRAVALSAFVLAGLSANMIFMGITARSYAPLYLFFTICFASLTWIISNRDASGKSIFSAGGKPARQAFVILGLGMAAMPWLHNLGLIYSASVGLVAALIWAFALNGSRAAFANFATSAFIAGLLYLPHVGVLLQQMEPVNSDYWIQKPTIARLIAQVLEIFGHAWSLSFDTLIVAALAALVCIIGGLGLAKLAFERNWSVFLLISGLLAVIYVAFFLVTFLIKPVMLNRAMTPILAPWIVLLALTLGSINRRTIGITLLVFLIGFFSASVWNRYLSEDGNWRVQALRMIVDDAKTTPTIITVPNAAETELRYYAKQLDLVVNTVPLPATFPAKSPDYFYATGWPGVPAIDETTLNTIDTLLANGDQNVWIYLRSYWAYDPEAVLKTHFDKKYCYAPVDGMENLMIVLKLWPRSAMENGECTSMGQENYFPFSRPNYGILKLSGSAI